MLDLSPYYQSLVAEEPIEESKIVALLKELKAMRVTAAYLASCHAASLEGLPKTASSTNRKRLASICRTATRALDGDLSDIRGLESPNPVEHAITRCRLAATLAD